jgi:predicted O-methyltransferase YrrM
MHPLTIARAAITEHGAIQKEQELASFLALLLDQPPEVVVEIGSDAGGTLWAWQQLPGVRRVIGVDQPDGPYSSGATLNGHGAEVVHGDSHDPATLQALQDLLAGDLVDLLFIDGDHAYEGVKADFQMYSPLVRPDGIIAFHDICHHTDPRHADVGVDMLWRQLDAAKGRKDVIVTDPPTWGGIGVLRRQPTEVPA